MAQQESTLASLDPQQLINAKKGLENDIQRFADSLAFFNKSAGIYLQANTAIQELEESKEGQPLLLPLTQSLYVSGTVASVDRVVVDIGTGYYVEGQDYCKRKVDKLKNTMEGVQQALRVKQNQLMQVEKELSVKVAAQQQQVAQRS